MTKTNGWIKFIFNNAETNHEIKGWNNGTYMKLSANQWEFARAFFLPKNRDRVFMGGERERERERERNGREGSRLWRSEYGHSATAIARHARPKPTQYSMGQLRWVSEAQGAQVLYWLALKSPLDLTQYNTCPISNQSCITCDSTTSSSTSMCFEVVQLLNF
jgi:hypothetical protein